MRKRNFVKLSFLILCVCLAYSSVGAQVVSFSYQGRLNDGGAPANGQFDFLFKLYGVASGGAQIGADFTRNDVQVTNGVFSTIISFGATPFVNETGFFVEVWVRPGASTGAYTQLAPRVALQTVPYALKSFDTLFFGGLPSGEYVKTNDPRLSDARQPLPNFNITGNGTVSGTLSGNIVNATTQFNLGGSRILSIQGSENLFAGLGAGISNTGGIENSFFGRLAGEGNNTGSGNSFFGFIAGRFTTSGSNNSFFGSRVGLENRTGNFNSFFGHRAGENNNGSVNSFFGTGAGLFNLSGSSNTFLGHDAGNSNQDGSFNTTVGENSDVGAGNLTNATAIGSKAFVTQSNSLILGSINGINGATADTFVGIGTTAPDYKLLVVDSSNAGFRVQTNAAGGTVASFGGNGAFRIDASGVVGGRLTVLENGNVGIGNANPADKLNVNGNVSLLLASGGSTSVCQTASFRLATCSSSLRYKENVNPFASGLSLINRLRPVSFNWKDGGMRDLGLVAEEVAEIEPLLVTKNDKGETEGVKYDRLGVVTVNAIKEQQQQIEAQARQISEQNETIKKQTEKIERQQVELEKQRLELEALKKLVCAQNAAAEICRQEKQF